MGYRVAAARGLIDLANFEHDDLAARVRGTSLTLASLETYSGQNQASSEYQMSIISASGQASWWQASWRDDARTLGRRLHLDTAKAEGLSR